MEVDEGEDNSELKPLNLARTRDALSAFDEARRAFDAKLDLSDEGFSQSCALLASLEKAEKAVGIAFAEDTADRNAFDTASLVRPGLWLRALVEKYG
jgi:hypothetical protein